MRRRLTTGLVALCLFASCGMYRPYSRPETDADGLFRDTMAGADTATLAAMPWRELFTDSSLQALVEQGLRHNTDLQVAHLQTAEAAAALRKARLSLLPSLMLSPEGGVSRYGATSAGTYSLAATASWELDIFGKNTNAKRGACEALEGSRDYAQAVRTQLIATIADSYYTLLMLDSQLETGERTLQSWDRSIRVLEALKRAGQANDVAVLQARSNRMQLEASVISLRKSIAETENTLSALLAQPSHRIVRGTLAEADFPRHVSVGVPAQLLSNRPDVRRAEHDLARAFYNTNVARAAFYPSLTLSGTLGWTNNGGGTVANPGQWLANVLGSLVQPLFDKGANAAALEIAKAQQEEASLRFRQSLLDAGKEVNNALAHWQAAQQRVDVGARQIETLREAVRRTEALMRHSPATYLEVLTAQQSLLDAEQAQSSNRFDEIQGIIHLYRALGGGLR